MKTDIGLKGRSILTMRDVSAGELRGLLDLGRDLKRRKAAGVRGDLLERRNIAMLFEKLSTRTRCAASVATADEGGHAEYLSALEIHLGKKESVADTARVLGRMFDGILFRGYRQETVETLAACSGVPVWNGLTDEAHPTQAFADLMTIRERFGELEGLKVVYVGDGRNNVANSLMLGCAKLGLSFVNCTPEALSPAAARIAEARELAAASGGSVAVDHDPAAAVRGANVIYTDVWVSMGEEAQRAERMELLSPYRVDMAMMERTGHLAAGRAVFLHCLPAYHDDKTEVSRETGAQEVTDDVFAADFSLVFELAENRMHTIKAMLVATMG